MNKKKSDSHQDHAHDHEHVHGPECSHHHHEPISPITRKQEKVGRNDLCPCGSQKKYKKCCGK